MVGVTYDIPDTGLLALIFVRPLLRQVLYTTDNLFAFQVSAICLEAQRVTHNPNTFFSLTLHLREKPRLHLPELRWASRLRGSLAIEQTRRDEEMVNIGQ